MKTLILLQAHPQERRAQAAAPITSRAGLALPAGLAGIVNLGNTCYMSCILQVVFHSPILCHYFLAGAAAGNCSTGECEEDARLVAELVSDHRTGTDRWMLLTLSVTLLP